MQRLVQEKRKNSFIEIPEETKGIWAAFSGGHDSLIAAHFVSSHPLFNGVIHIDTGIGIPDTQKFVIDTCNKFGWNLKIYRATECLDSKGNPAPQIYEDLVSKFGFPGANLHRIFYNRLKERPLRQFIRESPLQSERSLLIATGFRSTESARRSKYKQQLFSRNGLAKCALFYSPIIDFTEEDCHDYIKLHSLPKNPVKLNLCYSGECLCGAYAKKNELVAISVHYPEVAARIKAIEDKVKNEFPWGWEESPPKWWKEKQNHDRLEKEGQLSIFCQNCGAK